MTPQMKAFTVFAVVGGLVVLFFLWVAWSTRQAREIDREAGYRLRRRFFVVLSAVLLAMLAITMRYMPYPRAGEQPDHVVFAVGKQFSFGISIRPITNDDQWSAATYAKPVELPAGSVVEFRVTSFDVNHGFSVYSPGGQLLGQVQAMPGYVNRLRLRLDQPGTYRVLCLELCGMGHHRMRGIFRVVPSAAAGKRALEPSISTVQSGGN